MLKLNKLSNHNRRFFSESLCSVLVAILFALLLSRFLFEPTNVIVTILVLSPIVIFFFLSPKFPIYLLILSIIFTEFYWIEVLEGYLKPFHIISVLLFLVYTIFYLRVLRRSKITWLLIAFIFINIICALLSENKMDSLRSFILPLILISIAINTAVALSTNRIYPDSLRKVILYGSLFAVFFGILQMLGYSFFDMLLTLTNRQDYQVALAKRSPSFFTEAVTFGKFLSFPFFLLLPFAFDKESKTAKSLKISVTVLLIGIIINMTRSAMIGIGITLILYFFYLLRRESLSRNLGIFLGTAAMMLILLPFVIGITRVVGSYDKLIYVFQSLTNPATTIMEDGSVRFRKAGFEETFKGTLESPSTFLWGRGWGQSSIYISNIRRDVGGNLFMNIAYYSGIFALLLFLAVCYRILNVLFHFSKNRDNKNRYLFAEGLLLSFICMLIISQLASMWIAPEFWLVIGCAIFLEISENELKNNRRLLH